MRYALDKRAPVPMFQCSGHPSPFVHIEWMLPELDSPSSNGISFMVLPTELLTEALHETGAFSFFASGSSDFEFSTSTNLFANDVWCSVSIGLFMTSRCTCYERWRNIQVVQGLGRRKIVSRYFCFHACDYICVCLYVCVFVWVRVCVRARIKSKK